MRENTINPLLILLPIPKALLPSAPLEGWKPTLINQYDFTTQAGI